MNRPLTRFVEWAVAPERVFRTIAALIASLPAFEAVAGAISRMI